MGTWPMGHGGNVDHCQLGGGQGLLQGGECVPGPGSMEVTLIVAHREVSGYLAQGAWR